MSNCPECKPSKLTIHGERVLRNEIERLTADLAECELRFEFMSDQTQRKCEIIADLQEASVNDE